MRSFLVITVLFLFQSGITRGESTSADDSWRKAYALQQEGKYEAAAAEWQLAISLLASSAKTASSAHWNLGLTCLQLQLPDCTSYHWLKSIEQSSSFQHTATVTQSLGQLQNSLGLANNVTRSFGFVVAANVGENATAVAWSLALWFFVAFILRFGRSKNIPRFPWLIASVAAFLVGACSWYAGQRLQLYRSVGVQGEDVVVFTGPDSTTQLATLPAGAVVLVGEEKNGFRKITEPVPGWIQTDRFSKPFNELRDSLRGAEHSAAR